MRKTKLLLLIVIFSFAFHTVLFAQHKMDEDTNFTGSSYFKVSLDYISNNVYYGRKDSSALPYLTPTIGYYNRSGLFVEGSLSAVPKSGGGIDFFAIDGGYDFHNKNEKLTGELSGSKYFFKSTSKSVQSEVSGDINGTLAYDFGPVSITGGADVLFSSSTDLILNAGLSHAFEFGEDYEWSVTPSVFANIGSLNFYKDFYRKRKLRKRLGNAPVTITGKNNFSALDYEFSLPLAYDTKKWSFLISPYYVIPVNPIQYSVNGIFVKQEQLTNSFYVEGSIAFKLNTKRY